MKKKNNFSSGFDNFGMPKINMPYIPDLSYYINEGQSSVNPLESGVNKVAKATSFGFGFDEPPIKNKRRSDTFERGQRLNSGEAPLSDYELYQYRNDSDYKGGKNKPPRTGLF